MMSLKEAKEIIGAVDGRIIGINHYPSARMAIVRYLVNGLEKAVMIDIKDVTVPCDLCQNMGTELADEIRYAVAYALSSDIAFDAAYLSHPGSKSISREEFRAHLESYLLGRMR